MKGNICLVNLLNQFKSLITVLLQFIADQSLCGHGEENILSKPCLKLFESLLLEDCFIPDGKFFYIVYGWLNDLPCAHLYNRIGRIVLSKLGWNRILFQSNQCLLLCEDLQRRHALKLYQAVYSQAIFYQTQKKINDLKISAILSRNFLFCDHQSNQNLNLIHLAQSSSFDDYIRWTWTSLFNIRIHPLDHIPDESAWDEIIFGANNVDSLRSSLTHPKRLNLRHRIFQNLPRLNYDTELVSISKAIENIASPDQNAFAGYIALMMSDLVTKY